MITQRKNLCQPQDLKPGQVPDYICTPEGDRHYLSKREKTDYLFGGSCPKLCPLRNNRIKPDGTSCPNVDFIPTDEARGVCETAGCNFIGNQVLDRRGPNYCTPKEQPGCITLKESDLVKSDKELTDSRNFCDRLNKGCIFDRGNDNPETGRNGDPTCLRGCYGSKFWNNPKYLWGQGGTLQSPYEGSYLNSDLQLGPIYLEAAPSKNHLDGWAGKGNLPSILAKPYTESKGRYSPPCNLNQGDIPAYSGGKTGEQLAGPGCRKTPPMPQYGQPDWHYACKCPYTTDTRIDDFYPCQPFEVNQNIENNRDLCSGCYIESNATNKLYGHCVIGNKEPDTESRRLGCFDDPNDPDKCRVRRKVQNTECPHFCANNPSVPNMTWKSNTICAQQLDNGCWKMNPKANLVYSKFETSKGRTEPPFIQDPGHSDNSVCKRLDKTLEEKRIENLCQNCAQTPMKTIGSGTLYPNRSYCVVGGDANTLVNTEFTDELAEQIMCPPTCKSCMTGFFGEPLNPVYKLAEAPNTSSAFNKGIFYVPFVGKQANEKLQIDKKKFDLKNK